jgi:hypothetical protein
MQALSSRLTKEEIANLKALVRAVSSGRVVVNPGPPEGVDGALTVAAGTVARWEPSALQRRIMVALRGNGNQTVSQLCDLTDAQPTVVNRACNELCAHGLCVYVKEPWNGGTRVRVFLPEMTALDYGKPAALAS